MGNCLQNQRFRAQRSLDEILTPQIEQEKEDDQQDFVNFKRFKFAVQDGIAKTVGIASSNVVIFNMIPYLHGVDVLYTLIDVFEISNAATLEWHINKAISSGAFTSLLHKYGFQSAASEEEITVKDLTHSGLINSKQIVILVKQVIELCILIFICCGTSFVYYFFT
jgi:hypothetical protein